MKKIIPLIVVILGMILLIAGFFVWSSLNTIMSEVQNSQYSYNQETYISSLQKIFDTANPIGVLGFIILIIGICVILLAISMYLMARKGEK